MHASQSSSTVQSHLLPPRPVLDGVGLIIWPCFRLREMLIAKRTKSFTDSEIAEAVINAWNAWRIRRSPRSLIGGEIFPIAE